MQQLKNHAKLKVRDHGDAAGEEADTVWDPYPAAQLLIYSICTRHITMPIDLLVRSQTIKYGIPLFVVEIFLLGLPLDPPLKSHAF